MNIGYKTNYAEINAYKIETGCPELDDFETRFVHSLSVMELTYRDRYADCAELASHLLPLLSQIRIMHSSALATASGGLREGYKQLETHTYHMDDYITIQQDWVMTYTDGAPVCDVVRYIIRRHQPRIDKLSRIPHAYRHDGRMPRKTKG